MVLPDRGFATHHRFLGRSKSAGPVGSYSTISEIDSNQTRSAVQEWGMLTAGAGGFQSRFMGSSPRQSRLAGEDRARDQGTATPSPPASPASRPRRHAAAAARSAGSGCAGARAAGGHHQKDDMHGHEQERQSEQHRQERQRSYRHGEDEAHRFLQIVVLPARE